ncbi:hypothetical protein [Rufibacter immobilis]|uniref:hypothetical protein n=1 Tax=Rufibacter immobilis TaxID=1348778 RepID=UPI0035F03895
MNTFRLKRGILRIEGDRIFISGDQAGGTKLLYLLLAVGWMVFFMLQALKHYKMYLLTQGASQLFFAALAALIVLFWSYVGYTRGLSPGPDEIPVQHILKAQKQVRAADDTPLITLFLKNNRRRTLEFLHLDDLHFTQSLAGHGVQIVD